MHFVIFSKVYYSELGLHLFTIHVFKLFINVHHLRTRLVEVNMNLIFRLCKSWSFLVD